MLYNLKRIFGMSDHMLLRSRMKQRPVASLKNSDEILPTSTGPLSKRFVQTYKNVVCKDRQLRRGVVPSCSYDFSLFFFHQNSECFSFIGHSRLTQYTLRLEVFRQICLIGRCYYVFLVSPIKTFKVTVISVVKLFMTCLDL